MNTLLTDSRITMEALMVLENNLTTVKHVRRDLDDNYGVSPKIGTILNVRKPPRYVGRVGQALQLEDATETSVPVTLNTQRGVDIAFTSQDLKLSIDDFSDRFLYPGLAAVANAIDFDVLTVMLLNTYNEVGSPGTVPNQLLTYLQAGQRLDEEAVPRDLNRAAILSPAMQAVIVDALKGLFHDADDISKQYREGTMGRTIGVKFNMDQNVRTQTVGAYSPGGATVNGAGQSGSSIITQGWPNSLQVLNQGDIITFGSVFAVNPQNKQSTGALRQFLVTQNVNSSGAGAATIPIAGPGGLGIITAGPFQTVNVTPANSAAITVSGASGSASSRGFMFHKEGVVLAVCPLPEPNGVDFAKRKSDKQLGISQRIIRAYDINLDRFPCRSDILYGAAVLYPEFICRVAS
jgi:hypothetical protein